MGKIVCAALLSAFAATSAAAAETKGNAGINTSIDGGYGIQGEINISTMTNNAPISLQAFWKQYSDYAWRTTASGVAGIYDLSSIAKLDRKVHPYAGIGLMTVSYTWVGTGTPATYTGIGGGLYLVAGFRYFLTPQVDADFNYNNFGDLTIGVNFNF